MALSIGELVGYLDLDAGPFEKGIATAFDKLSSSKWKTAGIAAGAAAGAALASGIMGAATAEKAVNKVAAQLDLTADQAARAGKVAGKLYADNYGESQADVSAAVGAVMSSISGMRDASDSDVQSMTTKVLDLATAFELDVGRAAQVAGQMMKSGLAKDGAEAADLLTSALQKVPANVREDIMDAADEYGPFFSQLGFSGGEAMTMLVDASAKGMYGIDKTGDALKEFGIRATDMSKASGSAYEALGMNQEEMTGRLLAGGDTARTAFDQIISGLGDMKDPTAQSQAALALFGTPLEDLSVTEIPKFIDSLLNSQEALGTVGGSAERMGEKLNAGATNGMAGVQRQIEGTLNGLGSAILPIITPILGFLKEFAPVIAPVVLALAGFAAGIWAINAAVSAFQTVKMVIELIKSWTVVQGILNAVMAMNPIMLIVIALALLVAGLIWAYNNVGWFKDAVDAAFKWIGEAATAFGAWVMQALGAAWEWISSTTIAIWQGISSFFSGLWDAIVAGIGAFIGWAVDLFLRFHPLGLIINNWSTIVGFFAGLWSNVLSGIGGFVAGAIGFFANLPGQIMGFFGGAGSWLIDAGGNIIRGFLSGLEAGFNAVKDFVGGIGAWIAANKGPKAYDLALLVPAGGWIMDGLDKSLNAGIPQLQATLGDVAATVQTGMAGAGGNTRYGYSAAPAPQQAPGQAQQGGAAGLTVIVNNPVPETASTSIAKTYSRIAYLGLDAKEPSYV